jgi:hypothetical protein
MLHVYRISDKMHIDSGLDHFGIGKLMDMLTLFIQWIFT